jgi:ethanolamine permease
MNSQKLERTLTPLMLWGLGVGYVISGMYFGWNLGLKEGGTYGMAIATLIVILLYVSFSLSYAELACSIPKAGGAFDYASKALGTDWGFIAGVVQVMEFIFAPPAISYGIAAHLHLIFPEISILNFAIASYVLFTALNIYGVKAAAAFEFAVTIIALGGLILFSSIAFQYFKIDNLHSNALPQGFTGIFGAIPFAIWFFLGIEGVANVAEETIDPQKVIFKGFGSAMLTLITVCILTFIFSVSISGWEGIVFNEAGDISDSPLPLAIKKMVTVDESIYKIIVIVGVIGLIASFHGLLLAAGRATFELGRIGYAPTFLGKIHPSFHTPYSALFFNMVIGVITLVSGKTSEIIILAVLGALFLYMLSMVSLIAYRKKDPYAIRPFKVPFYPSTPILAFSLSFFCMISVIWYNKTLSFIFFSLVISAFFLFKIFVKLPVNKTNTIS